MYYVKYRDIDGWHVGNSTFQDETSAIAEYDKYNEIYRYVILVLEETVTTQTTVKASA